MLTIKKDYKIPYISRIIPAGTEMEHLGHFTKRDDKGKIKVEIGQVPKIKSEYKLVERGQVYGIDKNLVIEK